MSFQQKELAYMMTYPLHYASKIGAANTVRNLVRQGMSVNRRDRNGFTPLMKAITFKRPAVVDALIRGGANVNARVINPTNNTNRRHVIFFALLHGTPAILKRLLDAGMRVNKTSITPTTTHYAGVYLTNKQRRLLLNNNRLNSLRNYSRGTSLSTALRRRQTGQRFHPYQR